MTDTAAPQSTTATKVSRPISFILGDSRFLIQEQCIDTLFKTSMKICNADGRGENMLVSGKGRLVGTTVLPSDEKIGILVALLTEDEEVFHVTTVVQHQGTLYTDQAAVGKGDLADTHDIGIEYNSETNTLFLTSHRLDTTVARIEHFVNLPLESVDEVSATAGV